MLQRGDGAAAMLSIHEFVNATASLVFLINEPVSVGYLPYYKWQFAAMRKLSRRMATRLAGVCEQLEDILRLSSAACFGGVGFGEGGKGAKPAAERIIATVERICSDVVDELLREGLTESHERLWNGSGRMLRTISSPTRVVCTACDVPTIKKSIASIANQSNNQTKSRIEII